MHLQYVVVDVFTTTRFLGNPLAIVRVPAAYGSQLSQEKKLQIAAEFNLSETIFLHEPQNNSQEPFNSLSVDIFTPKCEIPFAGHPTIGAAAYILQHCTDLSSEAFQYLVTKAGPIPVAQESPTGIVSARIPFDYHVHKATVKSSVTITGVSPIVSIVSGLSFVLAELPDLKSLAGVSAGLRDDCFVPHDLDEGWDSGLTATKYFVDLGEDQKGQRQFRTRNFVSWEDPGTGSAASALGCYIALKEPKERGSGPFRYKFTQGVEMGRQNDIFVSVKRSEDTTQVKEVFLRGSTVLVSEGRMMIDDETA
ncbi:Diaminopimelate epimerase-like protein [Penicillium odoratum]|uniref:Diaminopimelate epimerase-like protein n=1 Tax=Penicillium odoratum TaxID=1167516 RepID=UPI0025484475|nr:Diaminopimelate epimerase-like protein [Penicillium odoratum]KAJ5769229.1 Diaminopimelate epimerase-like protein [Penicillium odoratum]